MDACSEAHLLIKGFHQPAIRLIKHQIPPLTKPSGPVGMSFSCLVHSEERELGSEGMMREKSDVIPK